MMKISRILAVLLLPSIALAAPTETPKINFGGGLDAGTVCSDIADVDNCDSSNFINDVNGAIFKRSGSKRYISQATSSNPITSLYRAYVTTNTVPYKALIMTSKDRIYYSTKDVRPDWVLISSGFNENQRWTWVTMNKKILGFGQNLADPPKSFDIITSSLTNLFAADGSSLNVNIRAKYALQSRNYLLTANVADVTQGTTYYPSRLWYSLVAQPSSMTASRFLEFRTDDGEEITGLGELNKMVHVFKETSISELDFTSLNLTPLGGDQVIRQIVSGFGLYAPMTLQNIGIGYILGTKDGLRFWDGGNKSRLTVDQESRNISIKIKPIIDRLIEAGTWKTAVGKYYPKKNWYILSYEDPDRLPRGKLNSILVLDLYTSNWFPFKNWLANCFVSFDGVSDKGDLLYGDSNDSYAYYADQDTSFNDARLESVIDTMDSTASWKRGINDFINVKEGTGAIKVWITTANAVVQSSATLMKVINVGEFYDKTIVNPVKDKLFFRAFVGNIGNLSSITVQLEKNDVENDFDTNFTSVTISSGSLTGGNTAWSTIEIALSSFPTRPDWVSLNLETLPFAKSPTFYGIRFIVSGVGISSVTFDDLRIIQGNENPLNAYWLTKQFNFGTFADKRFREIILNRGLSLNSNFDIDVFNNFGAISKRISLKGGYPKDLLFCGYKGTSGLYKVDSVDFSVIDSTNSKFKVDINNADPDYRYAIADSLYIYAAEKGDDKLVKIDRSSMSSVVAVLGTFGSGTTNFNTIQQMDGDKDFIYITDVANNRIKVHRKDTLEYVYSFGQLGTETTSYHSPTGICVDEKYMYIGNGGNSDIKKVTKSSGGLILDIGVNINTVSEIALEVDEKYLYDIYDQVSDVSVNNKEIVLEKRDKQDLRLLNRILVRPEFDIGISTYHLKGAFSMTDDFIYITFTDIQGGLGSYYVQKRLKSNFSLVKELRTPGVMYSPVANDINYIPQRADDYENLDIIGSSLQLKYSEHELDNPLKLYSQSFLVIQEPIQERK